MLDEYLNYLQELSLPGKCNRLKSKIKFHRDELKEEYDNLKSCKTHWLDRETIAGGNPAFNTPEVRKDGYKECVKKTKHYIQRRKELLQTAIEKFKNNCS